MSASVAPSIFFTGSVTMLDAGCGARAAAVADVSPNAGPAALCLVMVAADGSEQRSCP